MIEDFEKFLDIIIKNSMMIIIGGSAGSGKSMFIREALYRYKNMYNYYILGEKNFNDLLDMNNNIIFKKSSNIEDFLNFVSNNLKDCILVIDDINIEIKDKNVFWYSIRSICITNNIKMIISVNVYKSFNNNMVISGGSTISYIADVIILMDKRDSGIFFRVDKDRISINVDYKHINLLKVNIIKRRRKIIDLVLKE
jgi:predicted ATP-dependent serine protease